MENCDFILRSQKIHTMNDELKTVDWIAVKDGFISDLGCSGESLPPSSRIVDLMDKVVFPGFIDAHIHGTLTGVFLNSVNLREAETHQDVLDLLESACSDGGEELVLAAGYLPQNLKEDYPLLKKNIDAVSAKHPVFIDYVTYHGCLINTSTLNRLPDKITNDPKIMEGCNTRDGLFETDESVFPVRAAILGGLNTESLVKYIRDCADYAVSQGVTTIHSLDGQFVENDKDIHLWVENRSKFPINTVNYYQTWNIRNALNLGFPRIGGCLTLDGALFEHSEAYEIPYANRPDCRGHLYHSDSEVYHFVSSANANRLQVSMHAGGTRAIDQLLNIYRQVQRENGDYQLRHRIEHLCQPEDYHLDLIKELGVVPCMQPMFSYLWDQESGGLFEEYLGRDRADKRDPLKKIVDLGIPVCGGSDSPVTPINPLLSIHAAVNNPNPLRRISVHEAVKMFTSAASYSSCDENQRGRIAKGMIADFTILDLDPYMNHTSINTIGVHAVIVGGKTVFGTL